MNVPMYLRDEEREMDRMLAEKEARWEQAGLMTRQTAQEIEARRVGQYEKLQKILQEKQDEAAFRQAMQNQGILGTTMQNQGMLGNPYNGPLGHPHQNIFASAPKQVYPDPNTVPELQMPLEVAYNMWLVRFGDMWVRLEDVQDADGFNWSRIASRLRDIRLLEQLPNTGHCRLVPHTWT